MTLLNSLKIEDSSISTVITSGVVSSTATLSAGGGGHSSSILNHATSFLSNGDKENNNPAGSKKKSRTRPGKDKKYDHKKNKMKTEASALDLVCVYCNLSFGDKVEFQVSTFWN